MGAPPIVTRPEPTVNRFPKNAADPMTNVAAPRTPIVTQRNLERSSTFLSSCSNLLLIALINSKIAASALSTWSNLFSWRSKMRATFWLLSLILSTAHISETSLLILKGLLEFQRAFQYPQLFNPGFFAANFCC